MIQVNQDPHVNGYEYVPLHAVTGFFSKQVNIAGTLSQLTADGLAEERIDVFTGDLGELRLDPQGHHNGPWVRLRRTLAELYGQDANMFQSATRVLQDGGSVIAVYVNDDEDLKQRAVEILKANGASDVNYWGRWARQTFV